MTFKPLPGPQLALLTFALSLGTFIQVLDTSIANVSIPNIAGDLGVSPQEGTWVITSFSVSNAVVLPLTGWLSDVFGRVRLFVVSVLLFALTSLLCGLSPTIESLILFRVLQGAVAGTLIPLSQSLLISNHPPESQGMAFGFWSMVVIVAPVLGPILGGWLTDNYGWPWIFYINVPIGLLCAGLTWDLLKTRESEVVRHPIDYVGLILLTIGVGCLQIMLDKGEDLDWWSSPFIRSMGLISLVSLIYFIAWDLYTDYPIVNFSFFKDPNFLFGTLTCSIGYMIFFGSTVLLPLWLQTVQGYTPLWAGFAVAPIGIIPVVLSPLYGKFSDRFDARIAAALSFIIFGLTFFWYSSFTTDVSFYEIFLPRFYQGIGVTLFFIPLVQLSLAHIKEKDLASASGIFNFVRILAGGGFGTSIFVTLWRRQEVHYHSWLSEKVTNVAPETQAAYQALETNLNLTGMKSDQFLDQLMAQQAYMLSINDVFWIAGWIFIFMVPLIFFCDPVKGKAIGHVAE